MWNFLFYFDLFFTFSPLNVSLTLSFLIWHLPMLITYIFLFHFYADALCFSIGLYLINTKRVERIMSNRSFLFLQIPYKRGSLLKWCSLLFSHERALFRITGIRDLKSTSADKVSALEAWGFALITMIHVTQAGILIAGEAETDRYSLGLLSSQPASSYRLT